MEGDGSMYHVDLYEVHTEDGLYAYCDTVTKAYKCMYNTANYYIRNTMTGLHKPPEERTHNETEVLHEVFTHIAPINAVKEKGVERKKKRILADPNMTDKQKKEKLLEVVFKPTKYPTEKTWFLSYTTLDGIFKMQDNADYRSLPAQVNQNAVRDCVEAWKSYFALLKVPAGTLKGKPRIPKYKKNERMTAVFTNAVCRVKEKTLSFPKTKETLFIRGLPEGGRLSEVRIRPYYGSFQIQVVYDDGTAEPEPKAYNGKAFVGDIGLNNLITIADNSGGTPVVIKGGFIKSRNQWFNKQMAFLKSEQMAGHDPKLYHPEPTRRMQSLSVKRDRFLRDSFYKIAHSIRREAEARGITKFILGQNAGWKQSVDMGHKNNQNFVSLPFARFVDILTLVLTRAGIDVIVREESYTSKASFLDSDEIPTYEEGQKQDHNFSGKRVHRGLYRSKNGTVLNADVNGACNIGRKEDPALFKGVQDFSYLWKSVDARNFNAFYIQADKNSKRAKARVESSRKYRQNKASSYSKHKHRKRAAKTAVA